MSMTNLAAVAFFVGSLPRTCFLLWATAVNPFFLDGAFSFVLLTMVFPALPIVGILMLLARRGTRVPCLSQRIGLGLGGLWLAVVLFAALRPRPQIENTEMLVVGWDGATFQQMDPLQDQAPSCDEPVSRWRRLHTDVNGPMFSPLLWTSMAAGKPPEGIGFRILGPLLRHSAPRFWDLVEQSGGGIGVYKWLVTYRLGTKGFIVPAWLAPHR